MQAFVLLVEDEPIVALTHSRLLERAGYQVHTARSGEQAVQAALSTDARYDIVLMDIDLGSGIDGTTAAEQILAERDLPVLFLSSHTEPEIVEKTEKITSYGYVVKSSSPTVLFASMNMAFKLHAAKRQLEQAEHTLLQERDSLRRIMNASPVGIIGVNADFVVVGANRAAEEIAGRKFVENSTPRCGDFLGCRNKRFEPHRCGETVRCANCRFYQDIRQALSTGATVVRQETEFELDGITGPRTAYFQYSTAVTSLNGEAIALVNFEDITSTRRAQERMRLLSKIADSHGNIVVITDAQRKVLWVNQAMVALSGYSLEEFLGKNPGDLLEGAEPDLELKATISSALDQELPYEGEILNYSKDGTPYWIRMYIHPVHDDSGVLTNFVSIQHDVTERRAFQRRLLDQDQRVQAIMRKSGDGIAIFDGDGMLTDANPAYCELSGRTLEEMQGQAVSVLASDIHPEQITELLEKIYEAIAACAPGAVYTFLALDKNQHYYWREDNAVFFYDNDCKLEATYVFARRMTNQQASETEFAVVGTRH
ncbi:MAG: PAS domain S-box protein [Spirochaetaceae bacterium]|nr:MAG: PAS domain S-box protein [Spirochaetaceae bacterium]